MDIKNANNANKMLKDTNNKLETTINTLNEDTRKNAEEYNKLKVSFEEVRQYAHQIYEKLEKHQEKIKQQQIEIDTIQQSNESLIKDKQDMAATIQQKSMITSSLQDNNNTTTSNKKTTTPSTEMEPLRRQRITDSPQVRIIAPQNNKEQTYKAWNELNEQSMTPYENVNTNTNTNTSTNTANTDDNPTETTDNKDDKPWAEHFDKLGENWTSEIVGRSKKVILGP